MRKSQLCSVAWASACNGAQVLWGSQRNEAVFVFDEVLCHVTPFVNSPFSVGPQKRVFPTGPMACVPPMPRRWAASTMAE